MGGLKDVAGGLHKVGTAAFGVMPVQIKEAFSQQSSEPNVTGSPKGNRGSAAGETFL